MNTITGEPAGTSIEVDGRRLLTVLDAASFLSISRGAVYHLLERGVLNSIHIGRARRIPLAELRRFVDEMAGD